MAIREIYHLEKAVTFLPRGKQGRAGRSVSPFKEIATDPNLTEIGEHWASRDRERDEVDSRV